MLNDFKMGYNKCNENCKNITIREDKMETIVNTCDLTSINNSTDTTIINNNIMTSLHKCNYDGCEKSFRKPSRLLWHLRQHTGEKPYKCEYDNCDKAYTTSSHLKRHMRTHNPVQLSIKCDICKLILKNRDNYRKHYQRVHNNKNRILCSVCGMIFRKKCKLDEHMTIHSDIKSFNCLKCNKLFSSIYLLNKHDKSIHNRVLKCNEDNCNDEFFRFIDLRVHRKKAHPKEFHCDKCEKCFGEKSILKQHIKTHELLLFPCPYDECNKYYSYQRNLQHHINVKHMKLKYYCDSCGIGLSEKSSLIRHIRNIHTRDKLKIKGRPKRGNERQKRKDAGLPRKSMITKLIGLDLPLDIERDILNRNTTIKLSD